MIGIIALGLLLAGCNDEPAANAATTGNSAQADSQAQTVGAGNAPGTSGTASNPGTSSAPPSSGTASSGTTTTASGGTTSTPINAVPTIAGAPELTVLAGAQYSFTPASFDADGDPLTFTIANKPTWAAFDPATGRLSGTPAAVNAGNYANVSISVSDGKSSAALSSFTLLVTQVGQASINLNWTAPTQNTDGSALTTLAGYRILYGTNPSALTGSVTVSDPAATTFTVSGLNSGVYYFAMVAFTVNGAESDQTATISATAT